MEDSFKILKEIPEATHHGKIGAHITKKGYLRLNNSGKYGSRMVHDLIWEKYNGPIPEGYQIHHIDGNKLNNNISNLQLLDQMTHKRLHEGCKLINGIWYKPCSKCGKYKPVTLEYWYFNRNGWISSGMCRSCFIQDSLERRKERIANGWKRNYVPKTHRATKPCIRAKNTESDNEEMA